MRLGLPCSCIASLVLSSALTRAQEPAPATSSAPLGEPATETTPSAAPTSDAPPEGEPLPEEPAAVTHVTAAPPPPPPKPKEPAPVMTPFAGDSLGGQFQLGVSGMFVAPWGEATRGVDMDGLTNVGLGPGADLGIGVGRHVVVGAYGEMAFYGPGSACLDCDSTSLGVGAFVRYHLVQGLRFDPWVSYGIGYRSLSTKSDANGTSDYAGLEWLRVTFGGDWYVNRQFGFGPFVELGAASFFNAPAGADIGGVNWRFQSGLRILLDLPGR